MAVRIAGIGQNTEPKNVIIGIPSAKHKMELTSFPVSQGNTSASYKYQWDDITVYMMCTVSANNSGTSFNGLMHLDTLEFYDLTNYNKLFIGAYYSCGDHTGHCWRVYLVDEADNTTMLINGAKNALTTYSLDISQYTGFYKIRIFLCTGYATYGYGASSTSIRVSNVALIK